MRFTAIFAVALLLALAGTARAATLMGNGAIEITAR
jgi:hypothetical protein